MPELAILVFGLAVAAAFVLPPLLGRRAPDVNADEERDAAAVRHRVALESLRDVEADRRAGSLDDVAYAEQLVEAEGRAAATRAALDRTVPVAPASRPPASRRIAVVAAGAIAALLLAGSVVPGTGIANRTDVNAELAAAQDAEAARQDRIADLLDALGRDPRDTGTISELADEYLAGSSEDDLVRAAVSLQLLIELEPERPDAYERIMSAYLRAGDAANARAAHDSYAELAAADPAEVAFYDGMIALRGESDAVGAREAFDRFLELAPDDPRAAMVRSLRDDAAADE